MQFYKFFALVAVLVACALTVQGYPRQFEQQPQPQSAIPEEAAGGVGPASATANHNREKKFAIISPYSAIPAAYTAYPYSSFPYFPAASYPSFYSPYYF